MKNYEGLNLSIYKSAIKIGGTLVIVGDKKSLEIFKQGIQDPIDGKITIDGTVNVIVSNTKKDKRAFCIRLDN